MEIAYMIINKELKPVKINGSLLVYDNQKQATLWKDQYKMLYGADRVIKVKIEKTLLNKNGRI